MLAEDPHRIGPKRLPNLSRRRLPDVVPFARLLKIGDNARPIMRLGRDERGKGELLFDLASPTVLVAGPMAVKTIVQPRLQLAPIRLSLDGNHLAAILRDDPSIPDDRVTVGVLESQPLVFECCGDLDHLSPS